MSYLAPPALSPIQIDAGVDYNYVIAQQGYGKVQVNTHPNFSFTVHQGEPALLIIRFTGTPGASPTVHTLNIVVGSQIQTLSITVLPTAGSQRVPNITNGPSLACPIASPVSIAVASDIAATYSVEGSLPAGLTYDTAANRLAGAAAADGFYPLVLVARAGIYLYKRYFVLVVGTGTATTRPGITATDFSLPPRSLFDGDYTVALEAGPTKYEIPFREDPKPYVYRIPFWQFEAYFVDLALGTPGPLGGYYVGGVQASFKSIAGGVIEFEREFALLPDSRSEYESFIYPYQLVQWKYETSGDPPETKFSASINEVGTTVSSRVQYDYFLIAGTGLQQPTIGGASQWTTGAAAATPSQIPLPRGPRAMIDSGVFETRLYFMHGYWNMGAAGGTTPGAEVLAEDACLRKWKGNIYERKMRFITSESFGQVVA